MLKLIYPLKQVNLPKVAHEDIQATYDALPKGLGIRKADLWVHAAAWIKCQVENNGYADVLSGKDCAGDE